MICLVFQIGILIDTYELLSAEYVTRWCHISWYDCLDRLGEFYICSSVHRNSRWKKSNNMQLYADIYLLLNYSTCFGRHVHQQQASSNVTTWSRLKKLPSQIVCSVPEAATTVFCTPDDGCDGRPKHVE